jgi:hypothetical protein
MIPPYVSVVPVLTLNVLVVMVELRVIPRLALRVNVAVVSKVPPLITIPPAVGLLGAVPNRLSALIDKVQPLLIIVIPEYVLLPERVSVPEPD